jgi:hypothetical protein
MRRLIKNRRGVSQVVGFILTFTVISMLTASLIYSTSVLLEQRNKIASEIIADDVISYVTYSIIECAAVKQTYPNSNCTMIIDIPLSIGGNEYYIEATTSKIFLNTTNGQITRNGTTYKQETLCDRISGKVYSSQGEVNIKSNELNYIYVIE